MRESNLAYHGQQSIESKSTSQQHAQMHPGQPDSNNNNVLRQRRKEEGSLAGRSGIPARPQPKGQKGAFKREAQEYEHARQAYAINQGSGSHGKNLKNRSLPKKGQIPALSSKAPQPYNQHQQKQPPPVGKMVHDKNQIELIRQFGHEKGQEYYGAIKELEEFLDPSVLQDKEFQFNQRTKDEINHLEGQVDNPMAGSASHPMTDQESEMVRVPGSQRYHDSILGHGISVETQNQGANNMTSTAYDSRMGNMVNNDQMINSRGQQKDPYKNITSDGIASSVGHFHSNEVMSQNQNRVTYLSHDNNEMDNTHSDTVGMGSVSGMHGITHHSYVQMDMAPQTALDHMYPTAAQHHFKNPLALAPIKSKKGPKGKSKSNVRQRRIEAAGNGGQIYEEQHFMGKRGYMQTQGGRKLLEHTQGSPRQRALPLHVYAQGNGGQREARHFNPDNGPNRLSNLKTAQRANNTHQLIFDKQRSYMMNPISQSTGMELNQQASWHSKMMDEQHQRRLQEQRISNQSTSMVNGSAITTNSQALLKANSLKSNEKYAALSQGHNQINETLPVISQRQINNDSQNYHLDSSFHKPPSMFQEARQISEMNVGRQDNGTTTPSSIAKMGHMMQESQLTPMMQRTQHYHHQPISHNMSFQHSNRNERRRFLSNNQDAVYGKKGGIYLNQPSGATGKIILKKINHFFDNKKINKLYRNHSKQRKEHWKTENLNRNLYRVLPNDIANIDLSKVRQDSGAHSTERRKDAQMQQTRHTNRSKKGRSEAAGKYKFSKFDGHTANPSHFQQTPRSPVKKQFSKQARNTATRMTNTGLYQKEKDMTGRGGYISEDATFNRKSFVTGPDRTGSQELPEQKQTGMYRIPQTQQVKKRSTVASEQMKSGYRDCGTPEVMDNAQKDMGSSQYYNTGPDAHGAHKVETCSQDYQQYNTDSKKFESQKFIKRQISEPRNEMLYKQHNRELRLNNASQSKVSNGLAGGRKSKRSVSSNQHSRQSSRDKQGYSRQGPQKQYDQKNSPKYGKRNLLYQTQMSGNNQLVQTRTKGLHNASKQTMKRPFYQNDSASIGSKIKSLANYSQTLPRQVPTLQNVKKEKSQLQANSKQSKMGDTQQILYQKAQRFDMHQQSHYHSQSKLTQLQQQQESVSSKNYELPLYKSKKVKQQPTNDGSRVRSTSKKAPNSKRGEILRSVPNNKTLNKMVQDKDALSQVKGAQATIEADRYSKRSLSRSKQRELQMNGNRSSYLQPNLINSVLSHPQQAAKHYAIASLSANQSRLSGKKNQLNKQTIAIKKEKSDNRHAKGCNEFAPKSIMRERGDRSHPSLNNDNRPGERRRTFNHKASLPSNSSYSRGNLDRYGHHVTLNKSKDSPLRPQSQGSEFSDNSDVLSEVNKSLTKQKQSHRKMINLDKQHLKQIKNPIGARNKSLYIPEGLAADPKTALDMLQVKSNKQRPREKSFPTRTGSARSTMRKGLDYRFQLQDLNKYSQKLRYKDINWKLKLTALGKVIPDVKTRKKILMKGSHFNNLLKNLKQTDWSQTPIYHQYLRNGRWKHEDDNIYSEVELQYYISYLNQIDNNEKELQPEDVKVILDKYYKKTMHTLEVLMNQMNMQYYLEKIRLMFADVEPTVSQLAKIMSRCLKMYTQMDQFIKIFKLIDKRQKLLLQEQNDETLTKRLTGQIKLLLKEHPILPDSFIFKNEDLLEHLRGPNQNQADGDPDDNEQSSPHKHGSKSRRRRDNDPGPGDKESLNKTFTSLNSRDINAALSPDMRDHKILDTESQVDSLMAGM